MEAVLKKKDKVYTNGNGKVVKREVNDHIARAVTYIEQNLFGMQKQFALKMLDYLDNPKSLVQNAYKFAAYKDMIKMFISDSWKEKTGLNYTTEMGINKENYKHDGTLKETYIDRILKDTNHSMDKNLHPFLFDQETLDKIFRKQKQVIGTSFHEFTSGKYGENGSGLIYRMVATANVNGQHVLLIYDNKFYNKSSKIITDVKMAMGGRLDSMFYVGRFDSIGFMDPDYINKQKLDIPIPSDIAEQASKKFTHANVYNVLRFSKHNKNNGPKHNRETTSAQMLPLEAKADVHFHHTDEDFDFARAMLYVYSKLVLPNTDPVPYQIYTSIKSTMNAENVDYFDPKYTNQNVKDIERNKLHIAKKYGGVIPLELHIETLAKHENIIVPDAFKIPPRTSEVLNEARTQQSDYLMNIATIERYQHFDSTGEISFF